MSKVISGEKNQPTNPKEIPKTIPAENWILFPSQVFNLFDNLSNKTFEVCPVIHLVTRTKLQTPAGRNSCLQVNKGVFCYAV